MSRTEKGSVPGITVSQSRKEAIILHPGNADVSSNSKMAAHGGTRMMIVCFLGIFCCYFVYGLLQETITKAKYGEKGEKFHYTLSLVFVQCIINGFFARCAMMVVKEHDHTPGRFYALCSLFYLGAMVASNHSLQHVSYPTQVLGKSAKPIPVMILGVLFAGKHYPLAKYLFVLMIVLGVALFVYKDDKASSASDNHTLGIGELLLLVSLMLDGLTGATQDRMRGEHKTGATSMMFSVNAWSVLWLAIGLVLTGEIFQFMTFVGRYPFVIINMLLFSVCSAAGQMFIFKTVTEFGPLTCSIFTTTRKFFTILCSILLFGHPMSGRQWTGTVLVFIGLFLDNMYGKPLKVTAPGTLSR
ncbi:solute carrier family 35 member B1-like [Babylonia areolata]|uniref:solute carrier family 35 member B1-like n=1 Tax=Babylonia areolata TaxID=304850 RepID=UPI003FD0D842